MKLHKYAKNNNIKIHYLVSNSADNNTPVVFIPGVLFEAQDNYDDINSFLNYKNIFIDIRGKGKSDIPESGYTLSDQISDIQSVCVKEKICNFFLVGQSLGSALACKYAIENPSIIKGIILLDYLPKYPIFSEKWLENNIQQKSKVSKTTLEGLKQDSEYQDLTKDLAKINIPILLLIGSKKKLNS
jgi:pimeloyl-ACP methyl ester carboxylesterase